MPRHPEALEIRLTRFIEPNENGCWIWMGPIRRGSPHLKMAGERRCVRPMMYEMLHGSRPHSNVVGRPQIKMRCSGETCVNPAHMMVATDEDRLLTQIRQEVYLRGLARAQVNPRCRYMVTSAYIEAEAKGQLSARLAVQATLSPEAQIIVDQIQRRPSAPMNKEQPCSKGVGLERPGNVGTSLHHYEGLGGGVSSSRPPLP